MLALAPDWLTNWPALFNPLLAERPLSRTELFAGPLGLLAFVPLIPVALLLARWNPAFAVIATSLIWLTLTLRPATTLALGGGVCVGVLFILMLRRLRHNGALSAGAMIAAVWLGLTALILPLWLGPHPPWYPSRMAPLHNVGFAYFYLRLIAWGVECARQAPLAPLPPTSVWLTWLFYPPIMRLGPVVSLASFAEAFQAWSPRHGPNGRAGMQRFGLCLLGASGLFLTAGLLPRPLAEGGDVFATPERFATAQLAAALYLVPVQIYFLLWTYNELAAAIGHWLGLPVPNNFNWLPLALSVRDFWRRWHVTVGGWLRNYIYIPLGGNRRSAWLTYTAVFGFCAVWHGASSSFLAWGVSQAAALAMQRGWDRWRGGEKPLRAWPARALAWVATMNYQAATIMIFADFEHCGLRLLRELGRRLIAVGG